jgi:hypothetical protein
MYQNPGACGTCVVNKTQNLTQQNQITGAQAGEIQAFFASGYCRSACIPTTCMIENKNCGTILDGCGNTLTCGGPCATPDLVRCICADSTQVQMCANIDCTSGPAQDAICGPLCASHGGEFATGCLTNDPSCTQ